MCQLLGMNCNVPTDVMFSFAGFAECGGRTDHHGDGQGGCPWTARLIIRIRRDMTV